MINTINKHRNTEQFSWHTRSAATNRDALKSDVTTRVKSSVNKNVNRGMKETAEINFCGLSPRLENLYKSKSLHKTLKFANDHQLIFGASFALLITCILRPGAIMVAPSKKNKEDQKYASAHSIASGIIGFGISTLMFLPVENAIKRLKENPKEFITKNDSPLITIKDGKEVLKDAPRTYIERLPDILGAVPKGILTIALIPPILKYCFGYEKKKSQDQKSLKPVVDYSLLNFKSHNKNVKQSYFAGGLK